MKKLLTSAIVTVSALLGSLANAQTWTNVSGLTVSKVSCGSATQVVGLSTTGGTNNVFKLQTNNTWTSLAGELAEVSIANNGIIWGVNSVGLSYYRLSTGNWVNTPTSPILLKKITTNSTTTYSASTLTSNNIYRYSGSGWGVAAGQGIAAEMSLAEDGTFIVANASNSLYKYTNNTWQAFTGTMSKVAVRNSTQMLGLRSNGLYIYQNGAWGTTAVRADVRDISIASDGTVYIATTATADNIFKSTWDLLTTPLPPPSPVSLVAKYTFNAANANNEIGSNNNGTVTGATLGTDRFGNANKAYSFAGNTADQINFGDLTSLNSASKYSIAMWLNQTQLDVVAGIWHKSKNNGGVNNEFIQSRTYNDGNLYGYNLPSGALSLAAYDYSQKVAVNEWFHYAIVFDGTIPTAASRYKSYINGVEIPNVLSGSLFPTTTPNLAGGNLIFGQANANYAGGNGWNGKIDDIYIYDGAISQAKIDSLKNLGNPVSIPPVSLVAKYTFNAANANNEIGSNNNGTVTGATLSTDRFGNANKAYSFAGNTSDKISFGDLTALNNAGAYSIAMWLNQTQLDAIAGIWHKSKLVGTNSTFIQSRTYNDGNLYGYDRYSSGLIYIALAAYDYSQSVSANQWFHYAIVFDGTASITSGNRYKTYINGVAISNTYSGDGFQTTSPDLAGGDLVFGQADASYFGGNGWNGKIDDIYIYNGAISQNKVDSLKNLGNPITSIKNMSLSDAKVSIYPNPSKGLVTIDSDENFTHYQLLNTLGQVMKSEVITSKIINVSGVKSGIYQLILQDKNNGKIAKKLLIEN